MISSESNRVWNSGPPPHVGWWNASAVRDSEVWRWWDGADWSWGVSASASLEFATINGSVGASVWSPEELEWTDYYPSNAAVPRLDPSQGWLLNTGVRPEHDGAVDAALFMGNVFQAGSVHRLAWGLSTPPQLHQVYAWRAVP